MTGSFQALIAALSARLGTVECRRWREGEKMRARDDRCIPLCWEGRSLCRVSTKRVRTRAEGAMSEGAEFECYVDKSMAMGLSVRVDKKT